MTPETKILIWNKIKKYKTKKIHYSKMEDFRLFFFQEAMRHYPKYDEERGALGKWLCGIFLNCLKVFQRQESRNYFISLDQARLDSDFASEYIYNVGAYEDALISFIDYEYRK